jgi:hypothetical protein
VGLAAHSQTPCALAITSRTSAAAQCVNGTEKRRRDSSSANVMKRGMGFKLKAPAPAATPMQDSERSVLIAARRISSLGRDGVDGTREEDAR